MLQTLFSFGPDSITPGDVSNLFLLGLKAMFLLANFIYFIFSIIIVRQVEVMKKTLITPFSPVIGVIALVNLVMVGLFGIIFFLIL